jgi:(p)ppGpp synthase/HD superfamily hydrolase
LSSKISSTGTNILGCRTVSQKTKTARLDFTIEVMDIDHLNTVINRLIDIEGVQSVFRRRRQPVGGKTQKK